MLTRLAANARQMAGERVAWTESGVPEDFAMNEAEWLACTEMGRMLGFLGDNVSDRKLRLFACACVRQKWVGLNNALREAVEAAEGYADGSVPQIALLQSHRASWSTAPSRSLHNACWVNCGSLRLTLEAAKVIHSKLRCALLRDIFGTPFRRTTLNSACLTPTVVALAQAVYDDRAFDRMPELADALEHAGCTNAEILAHCRAPGPHVRGCWVVDLILGKA